jgi:hypothetical protein
MLPDDDGGGVPCDNCADQRALLHCAQLGTRLCLPCDVPVHAAAAFHERTPLCERCHAAAAAARCAVHRASFCAPCARAAGCDAESHACSPTRLYTGFPDPADLARILYLLPVDVPPSPPPPPPQPNPPDTLLNLFNIELQPTDLPASSRSYDGSRPPPSPPPPPQPNPPDTLLNLFNIELQPTDLPASSRSYDGSRPPPPPQPNPRDTLLNLFNIELQPTDLPASSRSYDEQHTMNVMNKVDTYYYIFASLRLS